MHPNPEGQKWCCFHPQHIIIGVCAFCLNERLLILLALKQEQEQEQEQELKHSNSNSFNFNLLPKLFAFTSLLSRFDSFKQYNNKKKTQDDDYDDDHGTGASTSQEDSFISIKFEGSGVGSWEKKNTKPKVSIESISSFNQTSLIKGDQLIDHSKIRGPLRWQKRIGHLFQVIRWKRTKGKGKGHVPSNIEGHHVKVRHGWMRSLTKRRTKDY